MKELKLIDYKLLSELMKDSHRSDRQLAKVLGVSQPTVTRRRAMLEQDYIDGYTIIPKFFEIGFEIAGITFIKIKSKKMPKSPEREEMLKKVKDWYNKQAGVTIAVQGMGMGWDVMCFSFHENYTKLTEFLRELESEWSDSIVETQTFVINFRTDTVFKPFHMKYLTLPSK